MQEHRIALPALLAHTMMAPAKRAQHVLLDASLMKMDSTRRAKNVRLVKFNLIQNNRVARTAMLANTMMATAKRAQHVLLVNRHRSERL